MARRDRRHFRLKYPKSLRPIAFFLDSKRQCAVLDISRSGFSCLSVAGEHPAIDETLDVTITFDDGRIYVTEARVVRITCMILSLSFKKFISAPMMEQEIARVARASLTIKQAGYY